MNQNNKTFEENMQRLEQIVRAMERGDVALDESLKLFQEGTQLVRSCEKLLDEAQLQVNKIATAADGSPVEEAFSDER
ncbi:MAG: exodeoxyribonuclease VII small subunit [Oscillospiraceae bacterium]|nr:exodeoxyribonuclease VII small subunit [Oscillospiraceae bacterium]